MEKYSSYKDSGVKWLGEIPSHWETRTLKYCCSLKGRIGWNGLRSEEFQYSSYAYLVTGQDFIGSEIDWSKCYQISQERYDEDPYIQLNNGDMLITKDGTIGKVAKVTNLDKPACLNSGIFVIKQKGTYFNQGFLYWMLCSNVLKEFNIYTQTGATIAHLYQNVFENMPCILPPLSEQNAIASYLDSVTTQIDVAISQQQKMIELLNERKQIIINNAVTKGLDPNVKMKDSGVDWIGEIPEHWDFCKFNHIISVLTDYTANGSFGDLAKNVHYQSEGYARLVRLTDLRDNLQNENGVWVDKHGYEYLSKSSLYGGELLIANVGAYSGLVQIMPKVDYLTTLAPNMFLLKLDNTKVLTDYIYYLLLSKAYFNWLQTIAIASAQPKLNKDNIRTLPILIPTIDEQKAIVDRIANAIKPLENLISITQKQISLLQERKQIIINEVVTGKVKVV